MRNLTGIHCSDFNIGWDGEAKRLDPNKYAENFAHTVILKGLNLVCYVVDNYNT